MATSTLSLRPTLREKKVKGTVYIVRGKFLDQIPTDTLKDWLIELMGSIIKKKQPVPKDLERAIIGSRQTVVDYYIAHQ